MRLDEKKEQPKRKERSWKEGMISNFFGEEYVRNNTQINKGDKYWDVDQKMVSIAIHWYAYEHLFIQ
jgi:hypothetical protein